MKLRYSLLLLGAIVVLVGVGVFLLSGYFGRLSVSPKSGTAPLEVTFSVRWLDFMGSSDGFYIEPGDGGEVVVCYPGMCSSRTVAYVYKKPGKYTAQLVIKDAGQTSVIGTASVVVGATTSKSGGLQLTQ